MYPFTQGIRGLLKSLYSPKMPLIKTNMLTAIQVVMNLCFHVNWLRVGCVDDRIGMNFCDVVSDDFKWHGDHLLSWDL